MTELMSLECLLDQSASRTSFLHLSDDKGDTSPALDLSNKIRLEQLEERLREYATQIRARDRELDLLYHDQSPSERPFPDFSHRFQAVEDETKQLKALSALKTEAARLRIELSGVNLSLAGYEEKLGEANRRQQGKEMEDSSSLIGDHEKLADLRKKVSLFQHANGDLQEQVETAKEKLEEIQAENDQMKKRQIPELEVLVGNSQQRRMVLKESLDALKRSLATGADGQGPKHGSPRCSPPVSQNRLASPRHFEKLSPCSSPRKTPTRFWNSDGQAWSPKMKTEYIPSFLRPKKSSNLVVKKAIRK